MFISINHGTCSRWQKVLGQLERYNTCIIRVFPKWMPANSASSENITTTRCGVFLAIIPILCFVTIHWIQWIQGKSFGKNSISTLTNLTETSKIWKFTFKAGWLKGRLIVSIVVSVANTIFSCIVRVVLIHALCFCFAYFPMIALTCL